ncbi:MAG: ribonuclease E activity regulator RraA [Gammaproteobacteria bacterium]|nr:ribonuclease E activity regulator RraA [Gammaproteobacteria bacterium]
MSLKTADLSDANENDVAIAEPLFADFGGNIMFHGEIHTLKLFEDNSLVRKLTGQAGEGKVLVVDGGGSMRCALLGGNLAAQAAKNGWAGIVIYGCIRDSEEIGAEALGVKALGTHPKKTPKNGVGEEDVVVHFADVTFTPGHYLYADEDGLLVSAKKLHD